MTRIEQQRNTTAINEHDIERAHNKTKHTQTVRWNLSNCLLYGSYTILQTLFAQTPFLSFSLSIYRMHSLLLYISCLHFYLSCIIINAISFLFFSVLFLLFHFFFSLSHFIKTNGSR